MLQFQEVLSRYKIEICYELIAILTWQNLALCFGQKYALSLDLGGGGYDLDVGSMFRIEFSICEWPLIHMFVIFIILL